MTVCSDRYFILICFCYKNCILNWVECSKYFQWKSFILFEFSKFSLFFQNWEVCHLFCSSANVFSLLILSVIFRGPGNIRFASSISIYSISSFTLYIEINYFWLDRIIKLNVVNFAASLSEFIENRRIWTTL